MTNQAKVVIYEPKTFFRALIADLLEREGHEVLVSENIKSLAASIYEFNPEVILVELSELKERDNEFLMALKKSFPTLPVICLVDAEKKELVVRYLRAGVFDCVSKPIIKEELLISVKKAMEFSYYQKEESQRLNKLKRLAHGSEKLLSLFQKNSIKIPLNHPGDKLIQSILDSISLVLEAEKVSLSWLDRNKNTYQVIASAGHKLDRSEFKPRVIGEGIVGYVAYHKDAVYVEDMTKDKRFKTSSFKEQYKSNSFMCGPIMFADEVAAVLSVSDKKDGKSFSEEDFLLFKTFLMQINYALEGSLMIKTLEAHNEKLRIYKEIAEHIVNLVEGGDIINNILQTIAAHFNAKGTALFIIDENKEFFINEGSTGLKFREKVTFTEAQELFLSQNLTDKNKIALKLAKLFLKDVEIEKFISAPIKLKNFPLGFLFLVNYAVDEGDSSLVEDITELVSVAFKNNWLYKNLCVVADELVKANRELEVLSKKSKSKGEFI